MGQLIVGIREAEERLAAIGRALQRVLADPWFAATYATWFGQAPQGST